jgi:hypothetical protein
MSATSTRAFPPASGQRLQWGELPAPVRIGIEERLGSAVLTAESQAGGFSPGLASRLRLADGSRVFVKAVSGRSNPDSPGMYRREARVAAALPAAVPAPALRWSWDDGDWVVLAFDDVDGRSPALPWRSSELERVLRAITDLAALLTPSPIALEPARETLSRLFGGWQRVVDDAKEARLGPGVRARLAELLQLEARWPESTDGESLVHLDIRADNVLLTRDRVLFVDWPAASIGAPWIDLVAMLPSVAMQGGPDPEDIWRAHPLSRGVDDDRVDAFLAGIVGYFAHTVWLPPPPGLPTIRAFQSAQGTHAAAWLAARRGWTDFRL